MEDSRNEGRMIYQSSVAADAATPDIFHSIRVKSYSTTCACPTLCEAESCIDLMFLHQSTVDQTCILGSSGILIYHDGFRCSKGVRLGPVLLYLVERLLIPAATRPETLWKLTARHNPKCCRGELHHKGLEAVLKKEWHWIVAVILISEVSQCAECYHIPAIL